MVFCDWHLSSKSLDIEKRARPLKDAEKMVSLVPKKNSLEAAHVHVILNVSQLPNNRTNDRVLAQVIILEHLLVSKRKTPQEGGCHCLGISE